MTDKCVIGWGTVGKATAKTFNITNYYSRSESTISLEEASRCRYIFICLPTPTVNGECDTSAITDVIEKLYRYKTLSQAIIVIRSTVYPGYNRFLQEKFHLKNIVSNPEFLSEDTWEQDATRPMLIVVGSDDVGSREKLVGLYMGRFKYNTPYVTDSITAEMIKYSLNVFFGTKIIFANALYNYVQKYKGNYETIKSVLESHPWGSRNHFKVVHKGGRGAGGKCLQKDMQAFAKITDDPFFETLYWLNEELLKKYPKK